MWWNDGHEEQGMWIQKQSKYTESSDEDTKNSQYQSTFLELTCIVVVAHVS